MLTVSIHMTASITSAFWSLTINNPSAAQLALIKQGYPDYCREIVWTLEAGEKEETPHIQAYVKLQRQQRMSFMKKLFPGGHYQALKNDEYVHNTKMYAQKDDATTQSAHRHVFNDPTGTIEALIPQVIKRMWDDDYYGEVDRDAARAAAERDMVSENYRLAKIFVSAAYKQMWKQFGAEMMTAVCAEREKQAHTHTHTHDEKLSHSDGHSNASEAGQDQGSRVGAGEGSGGSEDDEDYEDSEGSESEAGSESDDSGCSESYAESQD